MNWSNADNKLSCVNGANNSTPLSVEQFFNNDEGTGKGYFGKSYSTVMTYCLSVKKVIRSVKKQAKQLANAFC